MTQVVIVAVTAITAKMKKKPGQLWRYTNHDSDYDYIVLITNITEHTHRVYGHVIKAYKNHPLPLNEEQRWMQLESADDIVLNHRLSRPRWSFIGMNMYDKWYKLMCH